MDRPVGDQQPHLGFRMDRCGKIVSSPPRRCSCSRRTIASCTLVEWLLAHPRPWLGDSAPRAVATSPLAMVIPRDWRQGLLPRTF